MTWVTVAGGARESWEAVSVYCVENPVPALPPAGLDPVAAALFWVLVPDIETWKNEYLKNNPMKWDIAMLAFPHVALSAGYQGIPVGG